MTTASIGKPKPNMVLVWGPAEVPRRSELAQLDGWWIAGCLAETERGDRAAIYRTTEDQGIVALFDFSTNAFRHPDFGYAAYGRPILLDTPVGRAELLTGELADVFDYIQGRRSLPPRAARALARKVCDLPPFAAIEDPLPSPDEEWRWVPAGPHEHWLIEGSMRDAIKAHPPSWRKLGYGRQPRTEIRPRNSLLRMDLYELGVITECKLAGGQSALAQLDEYMELERVNGRSPRGNIVVANTSTTELEEAVLARGDVRLWYCIREGDTPRLVEVTRQNRTPLARD